MTPFQRAFLLRYRSSREAPPSTAALLARLLPRAVIASGIVVLGTVVSRDLALVMGGFLFGALAREAALTVHSARIRPVLMRVIDWEDL